MMKKEMLETYLKKEVKVFFTHGNPVTGILIKGTGYEDGYYSCLSTSNNLWFRSSHVKKIVEL